MDEPKYKRVLLKISGEALAGAAVLLMQNKKKRA